MDLLLYHFYYPIYWGIAGILTIKLFTNAVIHNKTDSYISKLEKNEGFGQLGNNDKRWSQSDKIVSYEKYTLYFFTTWWDIKKNESAHLSRLKTFSNGLNIVSIVLMIGAVFFFLYMQDINHKYHRIERNPWQYLPQPAK